MNLTAILKKIAAGEVITADEKAFLLANKELLTEEQVSAVEAAEVKDVSPSIAPKEDDEEEEEDDEEKAMEALISKKIGERIDAISDKLAAKFLDGVKEQRKKVLDTKIVKPNSEEKGAKTREFMKALFSNDRQYLKDVSGITDTAGGYLIPDELRSEILRVAEFNYGLARRDMRYLPFTGPGNDRRIPALGSSVSVTWTDEAAKKSSTAPTFDIVTQTLKKLAAIVPMTEEILEDSTIDLVALVGQLFAEAVAKEEDIQFFNGTGSPWTGILRNGSVNTVVISGTNPATVTADDLLAMIDATPSGALAGAKFYMNRTVFSKIRKLRSDGGGGAGTGPYIVEGPVGTTPATLWGYPVELSDAFPAVTVTGNSRPFILFGNLKLAAIFGDKQQLRVKLLDQATVRNTGNSADLNLAQQDMVAIRIVERVGYVLALPRAVTVLKTSGSSSPSPSASPSSSSSPSVSSSASSSPSPSA